MIEDGDAKMKDKPDLMKDRKGDGQTRVTYTNHVPGPSIWPCLFLNSNANIAPSSSRPSGLTEATEHETGRCASN